MKTHYRYSVFALLAFLAFAAPGFSALTANSPSLNASLLYYEPVPALPGQLLDVFVQLGNNDATAHEAFVEFVDNFPFSIDNERDRVKRTDTIPARESFLVQYKVRVSPAAVPGTNYIKVKYYSGSEDLAKITILPVEVFASTVGLAVDNLEVAPATLTPGREGTISFSLANRAPLRIAEGFVRLDLAGVDIIPVGSTNQQRFVDLVQGTSQSFTFRIVPSPDLAPGVYKIPLALNYTDQRGNKYSASETIGLMVGATSDLTLVVERSDLTSESDEGEATLRVTNRGLGELKFVTLTLRPEDGVEVVSGSTVQYIGNVDSDDYKTVRVTLKHDADEDITVPVTIEYLDALNNPFTREERITIPVREVQKSFGGGWMVIAIIAIAGIAYWYYRRR